MQSFPEKRRQSIETLRLTHKDQHTSKIYKSAHFLFTFHTENPQLVDRI